MTYEQHIERLRNMRPTIDCGPPRAHPFTNKREQDKRREFAAIEFDNKLLLERLAKVVQQKTIDNEIDKSIDMHARFKKKLALRGKQLEMQKITEENLRLLKRIQKVPPAYNRFEWEEDAKRKDHIKRCMCLYPEFYERLDKEKEMKSMKRASTAGLPPLPNGGFRGVQSLANGSSRAGLSTAGNTRMPGTPNTRMPGTPNTGRMPGTPNTGRGTPSRGKNTGNIGSTSRPGTRG